jgi:hypothetical protein
MKVWLETVVSENRRGRRRIRQRWVAEVGDDYVGHGRTRREAIANIFLRVYDMDFDSVDWKTKVELGA